MKKGIILLLIIFLLIPSFIFSQSHDYVDALEKAIWFFDANKCGHDVDDDNVFSAWRGPCHTDDGSPDGIDLTGGYHDAGDHVKFGLPQGWSAATLGWSLYEYREIYDEAGLTPKMLSTLKYFTDYFLKSHTDVNTFYYHVGDGNQDHSYWGSPELQTGVRPLIKATPSSSASDVCGTTAAALALMYLNYKSTDLNYANQCLQAAIEIYEIGMNDTGRSSDGGGGSFYKSSSHYDDLAWGGVWLSIATGNQSYLNPIENWMDTKKNDYGDDNYNKHWAPAWDDVTVYVLLKMAQLTGKQKFIDGVINNLEWYRDDLRKTPYGLPWLDSWGVLRYASSEAGLGYLAKKLIGYDGYMATADLTINYCLGDNPRGLPYLTNWNGGPQHPHHRANEPGKDQGNTSTNGILGALVGGPNQSDGYTDSVSDFTMNEVAIDYNAAFILGISGYVFHNTNIVPKYELTVTGGTGSGFYTANKAVDINWVKPNLGPNQKAVFIGWTGDVAYVANTSAENTTVTMPAHAISVQATYDIVNVTLYNLNVVNGSGDGSYESGEVVNIGFTPPAVQPWQTVIFRGWTGAAQYIANTSAANTTVTMPAQSITVEATYEITGSVTTQPIPGQIEAEDYDLFNDTTQGNTGGAYKTDDVDIEACSEGGYNVGWIDAGEWLKYYVNVEYTAQYDIEIRLATQFNDCKLHLEIGAQNITGNINVPNTGQWQSYQTVKVENISLTAGENTLTIAMDQGPFNINWVKFTKIGSQNAPTINITSPVSGANFDEGDNIIINANANDIDGNVVNVEFFANGSKIGEDNSYPYSYTMTNVSVGSYSLTAKATDNDSLSTISGIVSVTVNSNGNIPPSINITNPSNGAVFNEGDNITITAVASDNDGSVTEVRFYRGSTLIGTDTSSPYSITWSNAGSGSYNLTAAATDNEGASTVSQGIMITVKSNQTSNLKVQYRCMEQNPNANSIRAHFKILNTGNESVPLTELKIRYYYTMENPTDQQFYCDWANIGASNIKGTFVHVENNKYYLEISFTGGQNIAANSDTGEIQTRWNKVDWSMYNQADDYSFNPSMTNWTDWDKVTLYRNGQLVWGIPDGDNQNIPPSVSLTSPSNGAVFNEGDIIAIKADASDSDGVVVKVEFLANYYVGNQAAAIYLGEDTIYPYEFVWNNAGAGNYDIFARAIDDDGDSTTSGSVGITVNTSGLNYPIVNITSPASGTVYNPGDNITINADASDTGGNIVKVEFYANGSKVGEDISSPYSFTMTNAGTGSYSLTAKATDNDNLSTTSSVVNVTVGNSTGLVIPGQIEAEDYNEGGEGTAYHDTSGGNTGGAYRNEDVDIEDCGEGGYNVGWIENGEWLKYDVEVLESGYYHIDLRTARNVGGNGSLVMKMDGVDFTGTIAIPNTNGWQSYTTVTKENVLLEKGNHVLTIQMQDHGMNINWIKFRKSDFQPFALTIRINTNSGNSETVTLSPAPTHQGDSAITGVNGYEKTVYYANSTIVTLTATPSNKSEFDYWSNGLSGSDNPVAFNLQNNITVAANFKKIQLPGIPLTVKLYTDGSSKSVTLSPAPTAQGSSIISGGNGYSETVYYTNPVNVTLTASGDFQSWSGDVSGSNNPVTLNMSNPDGDYNVSAYFTIIVDDNHDDWLHTDGNRIVDMYGNPVWLTGTNWFGYNTGTNCFDGLWSCNLDTSLQGIADRGFNLLRVPISTELIYKWSQGQYPTANFNKAENPHLESLNSLEIFDYVLSLCKQMGIKVMIDVHCAKSEAMGHMEPMWYKDDITTAIFQNAWVWFANRYKDDDTIIAFDIENEPHGKPNENPRAKWNNSTDIDNWKYIAEDTAKKILAVHPNALIMVEGIEIYPVDGQTWTSTVNEDYYFCWWGGNLRGVADYPINLGVDQDQLVYSPHDYGPDVWSQQPWFTGGITYEKQMNLCWGPNWFYIYEDNIAPLLIGEWGGSTTGQNGVWMQCLVDLIREYYIHQTFWCYNDNSGDTGGLIEGDWKTWDEVKYNFMKSTLWQDNSGNFVGLDHKYPLGSNGITVTDYYQNGGAQPVK